MIAPNWYCYICGAKVKGLFHVVSLGNSTDRVFIICSSDCLRKVDGNFYVAHAGNVTKIKRSQPDEKEQRR